MYEKKTGVSDSNEGARLQKKIDITLKSKKYSMHIFFVFLLNFVLAV